MENNRVNVQTLSRYENVLFRFDSGDGKPNNTIFFWYGWNETAVSFSNSLAISITYLIIGKYAEKTSIRLFILTKEQKSYIIIYKNIMWWYIHEKKNHSIAFAPVLN